MYPPGQIHQRPRPNINFSRADAENTFPFQYQIKFMMKMMVRRHQ